MRGISRAIVFVALLAGLLSTDIAAQQAPALTAEPDQVRDLGPNVDTYQIASAILKQNRRIFVVLPPSFTKSASTRSYPVTVVLDGEYDTSPVAAVSGELTRYAKMPESIIVGIANIGGSSFDESSRNRVHDLTPPGLSVSGSSLNEGGDRFLDFIEKELLPAVRQKFRGGNPTTLIGHSSGGILATYAAATRPGFRSVIAIDTPTQFGDSFLQNRLVESARQKHELRYVSYEARFGWTDKDWGQLTAAAPSSWVLHREHLTNETHESMVMLASYMGLRELYKDYAQTSAPTVPTTSILAYYAKVSAALGATVIPPRELLGTVIEDLLAEGRGAMAREAYNTLVAGYGAPPDSADLLRQIAEVERRPPPPETVEALLATPFPSADQMTAFVGEWKGGEWMTDDEPRNEYQTLRIRIVDGKVTGETVTRMPDGEQMISKWQYLQVTPNGLTWGFMNGMRPRGVVLFEAKFAAGTLSGLSRFGGIDFVRPDGSKPPPIHFSFTKKN